MVAEFPMQHYKIENLHTRTGAPDGRGKTSKTTITECTAWSLERKAAHEGYGTEAYRNFGVVVVSLCTADALDVFRYRAY